MRGNESPWDLGVQGSQADQEHPACPVDGQRAIRSERNHGCRSIPGDPNPPPTQKSPSPWPLISHVPGCLAFVTSSC